MDPLARGGWDLADPRVSLVPTPTILNSGTHPVGPYILLKVLLNQGDAFCSSFVGVADEDRCVLPFQEVPQTTMWVDISRNVPWGSFCRVV